MPSMQMCGLPSVIVQIETFLLLTDNSEINKDTGSNIVIDAKLLVVDARKVRHLFALTYSIIQQCHFLICGILKPPYCVQRN